MNKKFISIILVVTFFNLTSCSSSQVVTAEDFRPISQDDISEGILVITKDTKKYSFARTDYWIENDTLYGKGKKFVGKEEAPFEGSIFLGDVAFIEYEESDWYQTTCITTSIVIVGILGLILIVGAATGGFGWKK